MLQLPLWLREEPPGGEGRLGHRERQAHEARRVRPEHREDVEARQVPEEHQGLWPSGQGAGLHLGAAEPRGHREGGARRELPGAWGLQGHRGGVVRLRLRDAAWAEPQGRGEHQRCLL